MNLQSLHPAKDFAINFGVKSIIYGMSGTGKTPIINTCPRPLMLSCEPGMLSMRGSNVPTFQAQTVDKLDEFFKWLFSSSEVKNFDTVAIDSMPFMAEIYLLDAQKHNKHGLKAYGEMTTKVMEHVRGLYYMQYKHAYLICKEQVNTDGNGIRFKQPYMPGQQLPLDFIGLFDLVLRLAIHSVPGVGQVKAFRCNASLDEMARDRTGMLAEFEEPHFGKLVQKAMA